MRVDLIVENGRIHTGDLGTPEWIVASGFNPVIPAPVEGLCWIRVIGQGGDGSTDGAHPVLVVHVPAC